MCSLVSQLDVNTWYGYSFNARTFCLTPAVCIRPPTSALDAGAIYHSALPDATHCDVVTPSLTRSIRKPVNCSHVRRLVYCAHGTYPSDHPETPNCPCLLPMHSLTSAQQASADWLHGIAVIVPAYPLFHNIYHYSFEVATVMHIASALPPLISKWQRTAGSTGAKHEKTRDNRQKPIRITLLFRGQLSQALPLWQREVVALLLRKRLKNARVEINAMVTFNDSAKMKSWEAVTPTNATSASNGDDDNSSSRVTCARTALFLGMRSHFFVWPFPNARYIVPTNGTSVPVEAMALRATAYDAFGIATRLPRALGGAESATASRLSLVDLPPRTIGYARRNNGTDATGNPPVQKGVTRRFSDADEAWFEAMLREEGQHGNMSYRVVQTPADMKLKEQVRLFADVGFVAGIHGANLVNALFMPAFGALLEVSNKQFQCYRGGLNSGLASWFYKPVHVATAEESACVAFPCVKIVNQRRVMIDRVEDRAELRRLVKQAVAHIVGLHNAFGHLGGVPVVYDATASEYLIDWSKQRIEQP